MELETSQPTVLVTPESDNRSAHLVYLYIFSAHDLWIKKCAIESNACHIVKQCKSDVVIEELGVFHYTR